MENICMCNNCDTLFYDTNPQTKAKKFDISGLDKLKDHKCPICKTDAYLTDDVFRGLWALLGNIPINNNDEIIESFLHFEEYTNRFEIWHWFEDTFDLSIAKDLMYLQ